MHHIRKLETAGFKSFCERTQILFKEGITAIVGPNGCGKSNIADAISWVVGEQSAKSLRTDRMEGVIFNGTQTRKPTSMTEVTLTLSLDPEYPVPEPLHLNPDEFTVCRRLYRSGESEYYLDGRRCRLKDIQALFEGTGLGPNSYALIEQGRIGQILSSKPADRRSLIEEAARITLFKSRRYTAEMKLELAQQNLLRVSDIIREVTRQLNSLRRQAAKARRYGRLREELRDIHKLRFTLEGVQLHERLEGALARFREAQQQEQDILSSLGREGHARETLQSTIGEEGAKVDQLRDRLAGLRVESGAAESLRQRAESRKLDLQARIAELGRELAAVEERGALAERERDRLEGVRCSLASELESDLQNLERERSHSEALHQAIAETEGRIEEIRSFMLNRAGQLSELRSTLARCQESLQRIASHSVRLEDERLAQARERLELERQLEERRLQFETTAARREELARLRAETERRSAELEARLEQMGAELASLQEEHSIAQHRYASLEEIERRRSNYSEGVQKFLSAQLPGEETISADTLADHLETDPQFEPAVEDYLDNPLQYILVDRLDDAVRSVERLKRLGAGRCTFMTMGNGHVKEGRPPRPAVAGEGVIGYLDQILRMREDVRHAFERVLPEYASTVVVSDLRAAFRVAESAPDAHFLTVAGEAYSPRGTLSAVGERKAMAGFLSLKREKRDLENKLASLLLRIQKSKAELVQAKQEQAAAAESLRATASEARDLDIGIALLEHQIARLGVELQKLNQSETVAGRELSLLQIEKEEFESRVVVTETSIDEIEARSRSSGEEMTLLGARLESLKTDAAALTRTLAGLTSAYAVKQERLSATENDLQRLVGEIEEIRGRAEAIRGETAGAAATIAGLEEESRRAEERIAEFNAQIQEAEAELGRRSEALAARRVELAALEERLNRLHQEREQALESRGKIEIDKTRLENDLEHLRRSCQEEYHLSLDDVAAQVGDRIAEKSFEEVDSSYQQLRERVENFGAVNMRALEEYQALDERHRFLSQQRSDIEKSIADTQKAIAEINRRSLEQFRDAFSNIRSNFAEVFQILFKGGSCDLRLLDETDPLESGIDIVAQPPGKRLQNVLLLSGGEKALTALALLIAIFRYRPSPFCVLDEVDAPLDDANVQRFTSLITELSSNTQFILITHNKKTMEIADSLYGVTMEEPGVSRVVSVHMRPQLQAVAG